MTDHVVSSMEKGHKRSPKLFLMLTISDTMMNIIMKLIMNIMMNIMCSSRFHGDIRDICNKECSLLSPCVYTGTVGFKKRPLIALTIIKTLKTRQ